MKKLWNGTRHSRVFFLSKSRLLRHKIDNFARRTIDAVSHNMNIIALPFFSSLPPFGIFFVYPLCTFNHNLNGPFEILNYCRRPRTGNMRIELRVIFENITEQEYANHTGVCTELAHDSVSALNVVQLQLP